MTHRQHRMLATTVALILVFCLSATVLADPKAVEVNHAVVNQLDPNTAEITFTEDMAIAKAIATFAIPDDLGQPSINLWTDTGKFSQGPTWNLTWEKDARLGGTRISYTVGIHAQSGEIVSYSVYQYDPSGKQPAVNYTRDEAQKFADEWYAKLVSADKKTELQPSLSYTGNNDLSYTWIRLENGIPYPDNSINITLNPSDATLSNFYCNWDVKLPFPDPHGAVTDEQALAAFEKVGGTELIYQRFYTPAGRNEIRLVYVNKAQNAYIDAITGEVVDYNGQHWSGEGNPIDLGSSDAKLIKLDNPMTRAEALELARKYLGEDANGEPTYASYSAPSATAAKYIDDGIRVSTWSFGWDIQGKEANQYRYLSATVDLDHGVLIGFNSYDGSVTEEELRNKTPISEEAARAKAIEFVKQIRPDLLNHLMITDASVTETYPGWPEDRPLPIQREYYFNFRRLVNGIRFDGDNLSVSIDRFSGKVSNFYVNWSSAEFPNPEEIKLTPEEALKAYLAEAPLTLTYTRSYTPYSDDQGEVRLVYRPYNYQGGNLIDPLTGHLLDYSGRDLTEMKRGAEDIAEHPAKRAIQLMIDRGVFDIKDGKFGPDATMTRGDVAKSLVLAFNQGYMVMELNRMAAMGKGGGAPDPSYADIDYDNGYYGYVEAAVRAGILIPKVAGELLNPDELVTNEELALLTARAMGYASIVNMKTAIANDYIDSDQIGAEFRNAVGLLAGLEVLSNEGEFKPQDQVTRADVAKVLALATQKAQGRYYY